MLRQWQFKFHKVAICALLLLMSACRDEIVHDLNERESNILRTELHSAGLESSREQQPDGRWAVSVERSQAMAALQFLNSHRVLREESKSLNDKGSIISSRDDQRFRYERALSTEIESTLRSIEGVLDARVHLNLPVTDPLFGQQLDKASTGSGSVLIIASPQLRVSNDAVSSLVAGASGIVQAKISVLINATSQEQQTQAVTQEISMTPKLNQATEVAGAKTELWLGYMRAKLNISNFGYLLLVLGGALLLCSVPWLFKFDFSKSDKRLA